MSYPPDYPFDLHDFGTGSSTRSSGQATASLCIDAEHTVFMVGLTEATGHRAAAVA
ncbi:hypothetical protein [Brevibacterium linens]|uniref:hypothetical protein n=1 Tax=Brevibacterium linens TaxID=1703 RepID=UPI0013E0B77A|nr:hypothetical protein [Brevibacterium linens]